MTDFSAHVRRILSSGVSEDATWTPSGGAATPVRGVFSSPFSNTDLGGIQIGGDLPTFRIMGVDVVGIASGDALAVHGGSYRVAGVEPDGNAGDILLRWESV